MSHPRYARPFHLGHPLDDQDFIDAVRFETGSSAVLAEGTSTPVDLPWSIVEVEVWIYALAQGSTCFAWRELVGVEERIFVEPKTQQVQSPSHAVGASWAGDPSRTTGVQTPNSATRLPAGGP